MDPEQRINISISSADGETSSFALKRTTPFSKLMGVYCNKMGVQAGTVRFHFDGAHLREDQTPVDVDMEEGDVIDAMIEQTGGGKEI